MTAQTDALRALADRVERLAFQMPAPNEWTPQFVEIAIAARAALATPAGSASGEDGPVPLTEWQQLVAERDALQAEVARWQKSFVGHVYVKDEDYADVCAKARRAEAAEAEAARLREDGWRAYVDAFVGPAALAELRRRYDAAIQGSANGQG